MSRRVFFIIYTMVILMFLASSAFAYKVYVNKTTSSRSHLNTPLNDTVAIDSIPVVKVTNKPEYVDVAKLKERTDSTFAKGIGAGSINNYDKLLLYVNEFFSQIERKNYKEAYSRLYSEFALYKGINNLEDFKKYISERRFEKLSSNITRVKEVSPGVYAVDCVYIRDKDIGADMTEDNFRVYLQERRKQVDETVIIRLKDNGYSIAFESYMESCRVDGKPAEDEKFQVSVMGAVLFTDNISLTLQVRNKTAEGTHINDILRQITIVNREGESNAPKFEDTVNNIVYPGQTTMFSVNVKYNNILPEKMYFTIYRHNENFFYNISKKI